MLEFPKERRGIAVKIGIISMQRVPNYGSYLQALGLKNILTSMGHSVCFVDYKPRKPVVEYRKISRAKYLVKSIPAIQYFNDIIKFYVFKRKRFDYAYRLLYLKELGVEYSYNFKEKVDLVIIGSDEVFNCLQSGFNVGFSPMLFGDGVNTKKVISYAACFGNTELEGLEKYGLCDKLAHYLQKFEAISVRDSNSYSIVYQLIHRKPNINLDPVLISDFQIPELDIKIQDFIILYTYKSRVYSQEEIKAIRDFAHDNGKKLISIGNGQTWVDEYILVSPLEMLYYFRKADFVITDTFHGTVFSAKYNVPFAVYVRDSNKHKLKDLIRRLDLNDRVICSFEDLQRLYDSPKDFTKTNMIIKEEMDNTFSYLETAIG